jgi:magnesium transporter
MITIYSHNAKGLLTQKEPTSGSWLNVVDPSPQEILQIQNLGIFQDFITYPLDLDEQARTEREDGVIFILLRVPYNQGQSEDVPFTTLPLGIILTDQLIITICKRDHEIIRYFADGKVRDFSPGKRNRFVLRLFLKTAQTFLVHLKEINKVVDALEDKLQLSQRNKEVLELLKYQKSLTFFTTALKSNELMMERLQRSQLFKMYPEDEDLLDDVLIENRQAIEMTNIASNILSSMMDAFASIISNNLNVVMKFLASVTILLSIPTIITSFYGMNVILPLANYQHTNLIILAVVFVIVILVSVIFWKKDWF